jgi:hypothetical protein
VEESKTNFGNGCTSGAGKLLDQLQLDQTENDSPENIENRINEAFLNPLLQYESILAPVKRACDTDDELRISLSS